MLDRLVVNFFWTGRDFSFINRMTIASHLAVGHSVILHHYKDYGIPDYRYWIDDISDPNFAIANAVLTVPEIVEFSKTIDPKSPRRFQFVSDFWRFNYLHRFGGWYADLDAVALKEWPDVSPQGGWMICSESHGKIISIGVLASPKGHPVWLDMIRGAATKGDGAATKRFTEIVRRHGLDVTNPTNDFYPINPHSAIVSLKTKWADGINGRRFAPFYLKGLPDSYSIHLFDGYLNHRLERLPEPEDFDRYPGSMFEQLMIHSFSSGSVLPYKGF